MNLDDHLIFESLNRWNVKGYSHKEFHDKFGLPNTFVRVEDGLYKKVLNNTVTFTKDKNQICPHNPYGPAIEMKNGYKAWCLDGKNHREDGPAVIWVNGDIEYWVNGIQLSKEEVEVAGSPLDAYNVRQMTSI